METTRWHCTDQTVRPVPTFLPVSPDDTAHDHVVVLTRIRSTSMISFFRKLSIGGKIKDGILPQEVMGTAEDLSVANNPSSLILKTDVELEESVYGKWRSILRVIYLYVVNCPRTMARHREYVLSRTFTISPIMEDDPPSIAIVNNDYLPEDFTFGSMSCWSDKFSSLL